MAVNIDHKQEIINFDIDRVTWQLQLEKESTRSSSNKWTKPLHQVYLHGFANFCGAVLNISSKKYS